MDDITELMESLGIDSEEDLLEALIDAQYAREVCAHTPTFAPAIRRLDGLAKLRTPFFKHEGDARRWATFAEEFRR